MLSVAGSGGLQRETPKRPREGVLVIEEACQRRGLEGRRGLSKEGLEVLARDMYRFDLEDETAPGTVTPCS